MNQDEDQLRLLSIFHYVVAAMIALFGSLFAFYILFGIAIVNDMLPPDARHPEGPPPALGWAVMALGVFGVAVGWTIAAIVVVAGRKLAGHRSYTFCLVVAGLECLFMPIGTVLGVFTIIVLMRPSVQALFEQSKQSFG